MRALERFLYLDGVSLAAQEVLFCKGHKLSAFSRGRHNGIFSGSGNASYAWFILAALMMGLIGDLLLVFSDKLKFFIAGLAAFLVGQLIYTAVFAKFGGFMIYDALIFIALVAVLVTANAKLKLELGRMKKPVAVYAIIISAMFTMAVSLLYKGAFGTAATTLIVSGALLFLASDAVLALVRFKKDSPVFCRGLNLSLYYAAQVLLALSIAFV